MVNCMLCHNWGVGEERNTDVLPLITDQITAAPLPSSSAAHTRPLTLWLKDPPQPALIPSQPSPARPSLSFIPSNSDIDFQELCMRLTMAKEATSLLY